MVWAAVMTACTSTEKTADRKSVVEAPPPVRDNRMLLPAEDQTAARVVPDHLLGNKALPGGTVGEYQSGGKKYQLFVIETSSPQEAAILLLDLKATLLTPAYLAHMGGYYGTDSGNPVYAFAKKQYL